MKHDRWIRSPGLALMFLAGLGALATGCSAGGPDASKTLSRERITAGDVVPAEELRVGEYLNYYEQRFPEPVEGELGLDLRVGNPSVSVNGGPAWLQIGLQARSDERTEVAPLNLAVVVDASGSMSEAGKMEYVKEALSSFLGRLAPNDNVALIQYSDEATMLSPSQPVGDGRWIEDVLSANLSPGGNTNLHAGLMTGLAEVERGFDTRRNNVVALLTDGIANRGQTDPEQIAAEARTFTERGIHLATIGLGHDLNDALLADLAHEGQGSYHFLDRPEEIEHVFEDGVSGLLQKAASDIAVVVRPAPGVRLVGLTGYDGTPPAGEVTVNLKDMGTGDSQVLLAELALDPRRAGPTALADVTVGYRDRITGRDASAAGQAMVDAVGGESPEPLRDMEVLRNATIQRSAEGLKQIDGLYRSGRYREAWDLAYGLEQALRRVEQLTGEAQLAEDAELMRRYQDTLAERARDETGEYLAPSSDPAPGSFAGRLATPVAPVLEIR